MRRESASATASRMSCAGMLRMPRGRRRR